MVAMHRTVFKRVGQLVYDSLIQVGALSRLAADIHEQATR
jgi:hypothetical protein